MDALETPRESDIGIVVANIERFERLCSEERSFGLEVESAIQDMDRLVQRDVAHAEAELETCRMECEAFRNRLQRAREGKEVIPDSSDSAPGRTPDSSQTDAATTPAEPRPFILMPSLTSLSPDPSPLSTPLDMDAFSVISDLSDDLSIPEEPVARDQCDHPVTQASTNPTNYLASIVERGISVCEVRRSLQEEILESLEKREKLYMGAVESAKSSLAMKRREATDIVTRLKDASEGIIRIILPWQHGVEKEAYSTEKKSPDLTPSPITVSPPMPIPACAAPVSSQPVPAIITPNPTFTRTLFPLPRRSLALKFTSTSLPEITSPRPNLNKHHVLLQRYEQRMNAAKSTQNVTLKVPSVPWPVLKSQFPLDLTDPLLSTTGFQANLRDFIDSYSQWKQLTFKQTSTAMLRDWVLILGKLKKKKKGGQQMVDRVIHHLRAFSK